MGAKQAGQKKDDKKTVIRKIPDHCPCCHGILFHIFTLWRTGVRMKLNS